MESKDACLLQNYYRSVSEQLSNLPHQTNLDHINSKTELDLHLSPDSVSQLALNPKGEQSRVIHWCPVTSEVPQLASDPMMYFSSQPITFVYG